MAQRVRKITDVLGHYPLLVSYQAELCKVAHHDFGAVLAEDLRERPEHTGPEPADGARVRGIIGVPPIDDDAEHRKLSTQS